ncbi:MAG: ribokinase [Victivallales bacterium]|nr:ribokinase [Victivallales bacterium]
MKILSFGSINVDFVYRVHEIVRPGETIPASELHTYPGGKGANQSVAMARAGANVWHAGQVGEATAWMRDLLEHEGVDVRHVQIHPTLPGGQGIIQVADSGENSIFVLGGTNLAIPENRIPEVLQDAQPGDWLSLQNEINLTKKLISAGKQAGLRICLNPSPMNDSILQFPLELVDLFVLNEHEAATLSGIDENGANPDTLLAALSSRFPHAMLCITLGGDGAVFLKPGEPSIHQPAFPVQAVDTTGAGDTFTGYLLASLAQGLSSAQALKRAACAAAISVSRPGAIPSIPVAQEVEEKM